MKIMITAKKAYNAAIEYVGLKNNDPRCTKANLRDGMFEIEIYSVLQRYDFFVDAHTGEVLGMNSEPYTDTGEINIFSFEKTHAA